MALLTPSSSLCPLKSIKNMYSQGLFFNGRDSIFVRLIRLLAKGSNIRCKIPGSSFTEKTSDVLSSLLGCRIIVPDNQKPRDVIALILDIFRNYLQIINFLGQTAGDGGKLGILHRHYRGVGRASDLFHIDLGKMRGEPTTALAQRLRVRNNLLNILWRDHCATTGYDERPRKLPRKSASQTPPADPGSAPPPLRLNFLSAQRQKKLGPA